MMKNTLFNFLLIGFSFVVLTAAASISSDLDGSSKKSETRITIADHFDYPVGKPDAKGYYNAQPYGKNNHLGDDWNGNGGGNTDFGDTIYAVANGSVTQAENIGGGWGNVIRITHSLADNTQVESLSAHCDQIFVKLNEFVKIGTPIGTIGTADGKYPAHLHFEMRSIVGMPIGGGYSYITKGYLNPTEFIKAHR